MDIYTMTRGFLKEDYIDFESVIWTERYYGDDSVEIVVSDTPEMISKLPVGKFIHLQGSRNIMMLETREFEGGNMKMTGIGLLPWMNNRFVRTSSNHEDRYWVLEGYKPGRILREIISNMAMEYSPYLDGTIETGVPDPETLVIPGLDWGSTDTSGDYITVGVPFGPLYDAMYEIATTYEVGMRLLLDYADSESYYLVFESYKGDDRTSLQTDNSLVRFSPSLDSFAGIKELQTISGQKTVVYSFAPANPGGLAYQAGVAYLTEDGGTGFDLRAMQDFADDVTTDLVESNATVVVDILNSRARDALTTNRKINAVDGEIVPDNRLKYGIDYFLGDLVEVQGNTGIIQIARVTEYIRAQDATGEKAYPTVTTLNGPDNIILPGDPPPIEEGGATPLNLSQIGQSIGVTRDDEITHEVNFRNVRLGDGILVVASAPSNPLSGDAWGTAVSCEDTAGNTYNLIHTSKFESLLPAVNEGGRVVVFFCESSNSPLLVGTDTITIRWDATVYDRHVACWIVRHAGGANEPTILAHTADNLTSDYLSGEVKIQCPAWTPARSNALVMALFFIYCPDTGVTAYGGVSGYTGFNEEFGYLPGNGSKQQADFHQQTHGATVHVVGSLSLEHEYDIGTLLGGVALSAFNGAGQGYAHPYPTAATNCWKGIIIFGID